MRAWFFLCLSFLAPQLRAGPETLVVIDGGNLPPGLQHLHKALAEIQMLSRNPLADSRTARGRFLDGPGGQGTGWHVGNGIVLTAGHVLSEYKGKGADEEIPFGPVGEVPLFARFHWGQNNLAAINRLEDRRRYARAHGYIEAEDTFYLPPPTIETLVRYAVSRLETKGLDFALLQVPKPWPEARIPLADGSENVEKGDLVWVAGYVGMSADRPPGLHAFEAHVLGVDGDGWYVLDRGLDPGMSGGPVIHLRSGKAIAISTLAGTFKNADRFPEHQGKVTLARDLTALKASRLIEVLGCGIALANPK